MKDGVSVCITAYQAQEFIKECLDSVLQQTWFRKHDDWEIIVGIDGCQKTLDYMKTIMHYYKNLRVLMMDSNKGTYITSNTIISQATYENIFRFDSDDIMCENLVETIMNKKESNCLIRYYFKNFGANSKVGKGHGTIYIKKSVFMKYGGFRSWPCGADTEIYCRLSNVEPVKQFNDILMFRRVHNNSLTQRTDTGMKSDLRKQYKQKIKEMKINTVKDAINKMETNTFKEITSDNEIYFDQDEYIKSLGNGKSYKEELEKTKMEETKLRVTPIAQLRDDIAAGKVVKVHTSHGYVWKRIRK